MTAIACCKGGIALAQTPPPVEPIIAQALELERNGRAGEAYALLRPLVAARAGNADFDYAFGLAAVDSGRPAEAIVALQRVLAVQPGNAQARAELARAYAMGGDLETARREFDTVVADPSLPDPVRQRFNRIVGDLGRANGRQGVDVTGFVEASGGYDSNINSATGLDRIILPLFAGLGPASLTGNATRQSDGFLAAEGGVSVVAPLSPQTRVFASLLGSYRNNLDSRDFDQVLATVTGGLAHSFANRDVVSVSGQFQQFWLGGDSYRQAYGPTVQYTHRLAGGRAIALSGQWLRLDYRTDPLRDANRYTASASYYGRTAFASVSGGHEQVRNSIADNLSNTFIGVRGGIERPVASRASIVAGIGSEYRRNDVPDSLFLDTRRDVQLDASVGAKLLLGRAIYLRPAVGYTRNISNIALYDYSRVVASLGLRAEL